MKKRIMLILISLFSATGIFATDYWTLIAQLDSTPSSFVFGSGGVIYSGTLGSGIYKSDNYGVTWVQKNNGLTDLNVYSLAVNSSGQIFAGTAASGVFFSSNNGSSWIHTSLSVNVKVKTIAVNLSGHIFAGTNGSGIYRSVNNGVFWTRVGTPTDVYSIAIDRTGILLAGTGAPLKAIYRSSNNGGYWESVYEADHNFNSIAVSPDGYIYAATGNLNTDLLGDILIRSTDSGLTWDAPSTFGTSSYGLVTNSLGHVFLGRYKSVWISTDFGENWDIENSGLVLERGILISYGMSPNGYLLAGQEGGYVYRTTFSTIGVEKISGRIPVNFGLLQNYPNPFNPTTTIRFDVPSGLSSQKSKVKISVYDVLGKQVDELLDEDLAPGTYKVEWDASKYPSGVYFYKLTAGNYTAVRKMILLK
jgi:Secretion system C-terminal sorting domain